MSETWIDLILIYNILMAVLLAIIISMLFFFIFKRKGPWESLILFFFVVFVGILATQKWVMPYGPVFRGIYWLPPLMVGLIIALLLAVGSPQKRKKKSILGSEKDVEAKNVIDIFLIILFFIFFTFIIAGYLWPVTAY